MGLERTAVLRAAPAHTVHYERRRPEETTLYQVVQEQLETFLAQVEARTGAGLPEFVKDEFEAFLECGILAHGFLRVRCEATGPECPWLLGCRPFAPRAATGIEAVACAHPSRGCSQSRIAGRMSVVSADGVAQDTV